MELLVVSIKVRPKPWHPQYWEVQCGTLMVFLFAEDHKDAAARASRILRELPYEALQPQASVYKRVKEEMPNPHWANAERWARGSGLATLFVYANTGELTEQEFIRESEL